MKAKFVVAALAAAGITVAGAGAALASTSSGSPSVKPASSCSTKLTPVTIKAGTVTIGQPSKPVAGGKVVNVCGNANGKTTADDSTGVTLTPVSGAPNPGTGTGTLFTPVAGGPVSGGSGGTTN